MWARGKRLTAIINPGDPVAPSVEMGLYVVDANIFPTNCPAAILVSSEAFKLEEPVSHCF